MELELVVERGESLQQGLVVSNIKHKSNTSSTSTKRGSANTQMQIRIRVYGYGYRCGFSGCKRVAVTFALTTMRILEAK